MRYRVTDDFKKVARGVIIYVITASLVFPVYHLIKGDFNWADTLINAGLNIGIALVIGAFFFFGSQVPESKK
jgi:hypothetical protein